MKLHEEFKEYETMWDTPLEWKFANTNTSNTPAPINVTASSKANNTKSKYVLAVDCELDSEEQSIDVYDLEFYRWGVEQDIGYEIADYDDLIDWGDKQYSFDGAVERAQDVLNMTDADKVYIIHVVEDTNGNVISAKCVDRVDK